MCVISVQIFTGEIRQAIRYIRSEPDTSRIVILLPVFIRCGLVGIVRRPPGNKQDKWFILLVRTDIGLGGACLGDSIIARPDMQGILFIKINGVIIIMRAFTNFPEIKAETPFGPDR